MWVADINEHPEFQKAAAVAAFGLRAVFAFPIRLGNEVLGVITIYSRQTMPLDKHLLRLLNDICSQIGQVMGRRRAERRLLEVSEREQQRIGQDLHDGLCQQLAGIAYIASDLQTKLGKSGRPEAVVAARIAELSRETAVQARQVSRGLNPVKMGTTGLMAALEELTESIRSLFSISCRFECKHHVLVPNHETSVHLYRIAQEAIHNAITHGAANQIVITLGRGPAGIVLSINDNGRGFTAEPAEGNGMGLDNMKYRARAIGARLEHADRPGGGSIVTCTLPSRIERKK